MRTLGRGGNAVPDTRGIPLPGPSPRSHDTDPHQVSGPSRSGWWRQPDPAEFTPAQLARAGYRAAGTGASKPPRAPAKPKTPKTSGVFRVVPATEADTIVATYRAGATIAQIHADTGRSPHTIRRILHAAGVTITLGRRSHGPGITPAQAEAAITARRGGATIRDAAARAGAPLATVHRVLRDAGLDGVRVRPARVDRDVAVAEYLAGESSLVVAARHGVSSKAVLDAVRAAGATPRRGVSLAANDPAEAARIVDAYQAGATVPTIAADTGHATSTIYKVLRDTGTTLRDDRARTSGGRNAHPDHVLQAAGDLYASGLSRREVADRLGIGLNAVAKGIRHVGATPRPRGNPNGGATTRRLRDLMASHGATAADIRRYARHHGLPCPTRGLPPQDLIRSYLNHLDT